MVVTQRSMDLASGLSTADTWVASSRVGTSTRPRGRAGRVDPPASRLTRGREKPRVLPEPVCARPRMSRPARPSGSVAAWTGNGVAIPWPSRTLTSGAGTPSASKLVGSVTPGSGAVELSAGTAVNERSSPGLGGVANAAVELAAHTWQDYRHAHADRCPWDPIRRTERPTLW